MQCGENPRILIGRSEFAADYHPLCQECHLELREKSLRGVSQGPGPNRDLRPRRPMTLLELVVVKTRFAALGLAAAGIFQLPMLFLNGALTAVVVQSIIVAVTVPWTAVGFWLNRRRA